MALISTPQPNLPTPITANSAVLARGGVVKGFVGGLSSAADRTGWSINMFECSEAADGELFFNLSNAPTVGFLKSTDAYVSIVTNQDGTVSFDSSLFGSVRGTWKDGFRSLVRAMTATTPAPVVPLRAVAASVASVAPLALAA